MGRSSKISYPPPRERRIKAALEACRGIPIQALEEDVIVQLVAACVHVDDPRIREILEEMSPLRPRHA